jgi:hypothetical protein
VYHQNRLKYTKNLRLRNSSPSKIGPSASLYAPHLSAVFDDRARDKVPTLTLTRRRGLAQNRLKPVFTTTRKDTRDCNLSRQPSSFAVTSAMGALRLALAVQGLCKLFHALLKTRKNSIKMAPLDSLKAFI